MKQSIGIAFLLVFISASLLSVSCTSSTSKQDRNEMLGICGPNLTWHLKSDGLLAINGTGPMDDFSYGVTHGESGSGYMWSTIPWYSSLPADELPWDLSEAYSPMEIRMVTITDGVTSIGDLAFLFCDKISIIIIPASVTSIGEAAFCGCASLSDIYYSGSKEIWDSINIGNDNSELLNAEVHFGKSFQQNS